MLRIVSYFIQVEIQINFGSKSNKKKKVIKLVTFLNIRKWDCIFCVKSLSKDLMDPYLFQSHNPNHLLCHFKTNHQHRQKSKNKMRIEERNYTTSDVSLQSYNMLIRLMIMYTYCTEPPNDMHGVCSQLSQVTHLHFDWGLNRINIISFFFFSIIKYYFNCEWYRSNRVIYFYVYM